jgi:hypothetical protein
LDLNDGLSRKKSEQKGQCYKDRTQYYGDSVKTPRNATRAEEVGRTAKHIAGALFGFLRKHQVDQKSGYHDVKENQDIL